MAKKFDLAGLMAGQTSPSVSESDTVQRLPVEALHDNSGNFYSVEDVQELCDSIAVSGVLQPVLVRPRAEGGYLLIAGHRRTKAVRLLRAGWKGSGPNPYDTIPAIVRPAPATRAEELLEELALIATNSAVRRLSDPELSKQAERMTDLLYGLKNEGYEFPGRMRKVVAEAVGVSETKIARLKKIREGLSVGWRERWQQGGVPEYTAEALAKLEPDVQEALLFKKKLDPAEVSSLADYRNKCFKERTCRLSHGRRCDWGEHFWAVGSRQSRYWERCRPYDDVMCCAGCEKALKCGQCCPTALKKVKKAKAEEKKRAEAAKARQQKEAELRMQAADKLWGRFKALRERAGIDRKTMIGKLKELGCYSVFNNLAPLEDRDREKIPGYYEDDGPENLMTFKVCWQVARYLGVPVEALTDPEWTDRGERSAESGDSGPWWRPFPRVTPPEGQRAFVLQEHLLAAYITEAKLARWRDGAWTWVSDNAEISSVEVERVTHWLPEPEFRELPEEEEDGEEETEPE